MAIEETGNYESVVMDLVEYFIQSNDHALMEAQSEDKDSDAVNEAKKKILLRASESPVLMHYKKAEKEAIVSKFSKYLWGYYILQDYIDDEDVSDIRVLDYDNIIITKNGKNIYLKESFASRKVYKNFVRTLAVRNRVSLSDINALQRFTDKTPEKCRLRVSISTEYVNSIDVPYLIIRKIPKKKATLEQLTDKGMLTKKQAEYLCHQADAAKGILFCGEGGSGKSTLMNALIEKIPFSKSVQVIQESDELFPTPKNEGGHPNVMCNHVILPKGESKINYPLSYLAEQGLLNRVNYFIIGELKGEEAVYLATASDTGHKCWTSLHANSGEEALERLDGLIMRYMPNYVRGSTKGFDTIIYMETYKVVDILQVKGFSPNKDKYMYERMVF